MPSLAYYNEIDPTASHVLRVLIAKGVIARGDVDTRSITEVKPDDLKGYSQCHFFAGGGLWSVALRLAGWPDERPIWTGSCPCQPFSVAGKGVGINDPRHLWPDFFRLIRAGRCPIVLGEQVAGAAGRDWFHRVRTDLESAAYAGRAVDVPSCAVDAPHIRQRLYWLAVADTANKRREHARATWERRAGLADDDARNCDMADADRGGRSGRQEDAQREEIKRNAAERAIDCNLAGPNNAGLERQRQLQLYEAGREDSIGPGAHVDAGTRSYWADNEWIKCHDGKTRRTKSGLRLLVNGLPGRVGLWRIAGNAINPVLAAEVIKSVIEATGGWA